MKNKFYTYIQTLQDQICKQLDKSFVIFFLTLLSLNAFSQSYKTDSLAVQKTINKYNPKKENKKVIVISEENECSLIKSYIIKKKAEIKNKKDKIEKLNKIRIGKRYLDGDKTVIPEILKVIKRKNKNNIFELTNDLQLDYNSRNKGLILENEIVEEFKKLLNDEYFENIVVQFLGYNRVNGAEEIFEERLISGLSKDNDRIFYWLATNYNNKKAIDYLHSAYFSKTIELEKMSWVFNGFEEYLKNNSKEINSKILEIAYDYLKKNPIKKSSFEIEKGEYLFVDTPMNLKFFGILLEFGDVKAYTILEDILKNLEGTNLYETFKHKISLFKINSHTKEERRIIFLKELENFDDYFETLELIKSDKELYYDEEINKVILESFEKIISKKLNEFDFLDDYDSTRIINFLENQNKEFVLKNLKNHIQKEQLKTHLIKIYLNSKMSYKEISDLLLSHGIIDSMITELDLEKYNNKEFHLDEINTIEACLEIKEIALDFDTEVGMIPVDYDVLLDNFSKISKGKIDDIHSYVQCRIDRKSESVFYQFLVSYKNKCYIMIPENQEDWYDIDTFQKLIDTLVRDTKCKEEFVSMETGGQDAYYIFGEKEKIELIKNTFYPEYLKN